MALSLGDVFVLLLGDIFVQEKRYAMYELHMVC